MSAPVRRALVTGGEGQVGRALARVLAAADVPVAAPGRAALDVTDADAVAAAIAAADADVVFHCAAWTDVDGAERDPAGAERVNAHGTAVVAQACAAAGARLVALSTDFVFDGAKGAPYVESDAPAPLSAYGRTKLAGEHAALAAHPAGAYVVRTAWVYDEGPRNFPALVLRLARERGVVRAAVDQAGSPTYAGHLAQALVELVATCPPGLYHLAGSGAATRHAWADAVVRAAGLDVPVEEASAAEFPAPAQRPAASALASERAGAPVLPPWREGVRACLGAREAVR